jgi:hypothetical protein
MTKLLAEHAPHLAFVVLGVVAFFWTAYRKPADARRPEVRSDQPQRAVAPRTVRRSVARRGVLALGPLVGAVGTAAALYGFNVGGRPLPGALIWAHVGISLLALLLVAYKLIDVGFRRIRGAFELRRLPGLLSIVLVALSVPLLGTGFALLIAPGTASFAAYTHLIASAWWTGLLLWHLRRYLGASVRVLLRPRTAVAVAPGHTPSDAAAAAPAPASD